VATTTPSRNSTSPPIRPKPKKLPFPLNLYQTAVGKKWVMAVTGLGLLGFVFVHMLGNLKVFLGWQEEEGAYDLDIYGEYLRELLVPLFPHGAFLWLMRIGLIVMFGLHIHAAYSLTRLNHASNQPYAAKRDWIAANFASRSMRYTGVITLLYLLFHLGDLTWGVGPEYSGWAQGAVHENLVGSLQRPAVAIIYILANVALAIHIFHGVWSMFQSLGWSNPNYDWMRRGLSMGFAALILVGNLTIILSIWTGAVGLEDF
jgi:succinate dehydrogenase / fumarate reductase cytochrome b subunit